MSGAWRLTIAGLATALAFGSFAASAQEAPTTNAPAADAVGPRELQNFSLQGNVTRPADQPPQATPAPAARPDADRAPTTDTPPAARAAPRHVAQASKTQLRQEAPAPEAGVARARSASSEEASAATLSQPLPTTPAPIPTVTGPAPSAASAPFTPPPAGAVAPEHGFSLLPWLLAALAVAGGAAFLFLRNRQRPAFAGGPALERYVAPEPAPEPEPTPGIRWLPNPAPAPAPELRTQQAAPAAAPAPAPAPRVDAPAPAAKPVGIVSTALRPWVDMNIEPLRCVLTDETVTFEFNLELFNSGSSPARDIFAEAVMINAGETQDQELAAFFARPAGPGNRIDVIQPLSRAVFPTQVVAPRASVRVFEIGGRQVFVPLLAFNAFYRRGSGEGRTAVAYLVGRQGQGEKLAPFRADTGSRAFTGLGARQLPVGIRN